MKKKKLKKKIKELEKRIEKIKELEKRVDSLSNKISNLGDGYVRIRQDQNKQICRINSLEQDKVEIKNDISKLENDNKYYKEWMDRSGVDYKSWFKTDSRSCTDCKYYELINSNGPIPCYGCTSTDKKMFEPKGENNGN